jgi:nucleotide-binding universal stress UspA family protein
MLTIQTILHPTDFSEHSKPAFQLACALARDYHARLIVLHVAELPTAVGGADMLVLPLEIDWSGLHKQLEQLEPIVPGVKMERRLVQGEAVESILQLAQEEGVDIIVVGTHGRTGVARLLMGSVAEMVLRRAHCPVVTVKDPLPHSETVADQGREAALQVQ